MPITSLKFAVKLTQKYLMTPKDASTLLCEIVLLKLCTDRPKTATAGQPRTL